MAPHSSTLAWKIPWTEEPGRLQSMWSQRVGHDWANSLFLWNPGKVKEAEESLFPTNKKPGTWKGLVSTGFCSISQGLTIFFFFFLPVWLTNGIGHFFQLQSCLITKQLDNDLNAAVKNCWLTEAMADNPAKSVWHMWGAATFSCNPMLHSDSCSHCPFFFPPASLCLQLLYNARHLC